MLVEQHDAARDPHRLDERLHLQAHDARRRRGRHAQRRDVHLHRQRGERRGLERRPPEPRPAARRRPARASAPSSTPSAASSLPAASPSGRARRSRSRAPRPSRRAAASMTPSARWTISAQLVTRAVTVGGTGNNGDTYTLQIGGAPRQYSVTSGPLDPAHVVQGLDAPRAAGHLHVDRCRRDALHHRHRGVHARPRHRPQHRCLRRPDDLRHAADRLDAGSPRRAGRPERERAAAGRHLDAHRRTASSTRSSSRAPGRRTSCSSTARRTRSPVAARLPTRSPSASALPFPPASRPTSPAAT